jgi:hypothetical protein
MVVNAGAKCQCLCAETSQCIAALASKFVMTMVHEEACLQCTGSWHVSDLDVQMLCCRLSSQTLLFIIFTEYAAACIARSWQQLASLQISAVTQHLRSTASALMSLLLCHRPLAKVWR